MKAKNVCGIVSIILSCLAMVIMIVDFSIYLYVDYVLHGGGVPVLILIPGSILAIVGIICGIIGLKSQKRALAISGLALGIIFFILLPFGFGWI